MGEPNYNFHGSATAALRQTNDYPKGRPKAYSRTCRRAHKTAAAQTGAVEKDGRAPIGERDRRQKTIVYRMGTGRFFIPRW